MRRVNAIITMAIMALFLVHLVWGGLILAGLAKGGSGVFRVLSYIMLLFILFHVIISTKLTVDTCISLHRAGVSYWKENRIFWVRRLSGIALMLFIACHVLIFTGRESGGSYRLNYFGALELATQILMVVSLLVHLATNIRPLKIALGLEDRKNLRTDIILVISILLILSGIAFLIYYVRWRVI